MLGLRHLRGGAARNGDLRQTVLEIGADTTLVYACRYKVMLLLEAW
jgi:hypothetical protein